VKKISFSWGRWAISREKKEGVERERGALGGDERCMGREKLLHTPLPHSIHIGKSDINLYWSAGEAI